MYPNLPGETPNGTKFAQRLRTIRNINRLSQDDLAQMLGTSRTVIAKWEMGKREPSLTGVMRICNLFDVSADYMLGRVDDVLDAVDADGAMVAHVHDALDVCQLSCHCKGLPQTEHQRSIGRVDDKQIPGQEDLSDAGHRRGTGINETLFQTLDMTDEYCGCVDFK